MNCTHCNVPLTDDIGYPICDTCSEMAERVNNCTLKCYTENEHEYYCDHCGRDFQHTGLPTICEHCGSHALTSGLTLVDIHIRKKQREAISETFSIAVA